MKHVLFGVFALFLPLGAFAIDADGFFFAQLATADFGGKGTRVTNGVMRAVYKIEEGMLVVCLNKKRKSTDCDEQWMSPSAAVAKLVKNACYLGFEVNMGEPVFYYRVNRPCD